MYIKKLESCLEETSCVYMTLASTIIILLRCIHHIVLVEKSPYELHKKLKIVKANIDNIKNIIRSQFKENLWCDNESKDKRKLESRR
jgi:hypothetical protein